MKLNKDNTVKILKGKENGPVVTICGCIHGDEKIGLSILNWLIDTIHTQKLKGELRLIFGNPEAYDNNTRFIDTDLNRLFTPQSLDHIHKKNETQRNNEEKRAAYISQFFEDTDYLLDIHATGKPTKYPFAFCASSDAHLEIARVFNVDYIIVEEINTNMSDGPTDTYVDSKGGLGITIEAGWLGDKNLEHNLQNDVMAYLNEIGIYPYDMPTHQKAPKTLSIFHEIIAHSDNFEFLSSFENFHMFQRDDIIAHDKDISVKAPQDCFLIFPKRVIKAGKEAGYLARIET